MVKKNKTTESSKQDPHLLGEQNYTKIMDEKRSSGSIKDGIKEEELGKRECLGRKM